MTLAGLAGLAHYNIEGRKRKKKKGMPKYIYVRLLFDVKMN